MNIEPLEPLYLATPLDLLYRLVLIARDGNYSEREADQLLLAAEKTLISNGYDMEWEDLE